jgi:branched-chain amino acid transport system substrate-binding protein
MAIVFENSMYGTSGAMHMMDFCRENAIEITGIIGYPKEKASPIYIRPLLAPLTLEPPDIIYMVSYLDDAVITVKEINCGGAGGFTQEEFIKRAGKAAENLVTATLWSKESPYPGVMEYYNRYMTKYGEKPDYHGVEAYSALLVAADVLKRAKSFDSKDIRNALDKTYFMTPFGRIKFYSYGRFERQNVHRTQVLQVQNGDFRSIWPEDIADVRFIDPFSNVE